MCPSPTQTQNVAPSDSRFGAGAVPKKTPPRRETRVPSAWSSPPRLPRILHAGKDPQEVGRDPTARDLREEGE